MFINCQITVYYVPRQSSRWLYEDEEFNVWAEGEDGKTACEYKQLDCLGTYDTFSEIGKRKREFVCREAELKLRLIILRTCTCKVISYLYRNKLDIAGREEGVQGAKAPVRGLEGEAPLGVQRRSPFRRVSLPLVAVQ